jgi:hypothetical protein
MQQVGVHAVLLGYRSDRYTGLVAHGHQCGLELRGVSAVRAPLRIPRGLRVFEHRVHVLVACTRSSSVRLSHSRWGSSGAYDVLAKTKLIGQANFTGQALLCFATYNLVRMGSIGGWWNAHHA